MADRFVSVFERLERFADRPAAIAMIGLWATAEAIVLPVVPDVGLCLLVLAAPRRSAHLFAAVVVGAVVGTVVLAALSAQAPDAVRAMLLGLPGIDPAMLAEADGTLDRHGIAGFARFGPGTPLKVFTDAWVVQGGEVPGLLVGAALNRLTRIGPAVLVAAAVGWFLGRWIRRREGLTLAAYGAFWLLVYAILLG